MKWDDALDVWAAHGVGGLLGSILLGVFAYALGQRCRAERAHRRQRCASSASRSAAAALVAAYAFVVTWIILKVLNRFEPVRVPDSFELQGLDTEMEEEQAYILT